MRRIPWFALSAALLRAQEGGDVGWDPKYVNHPPPIWQKVLIWIFIALVIYAYWRLVKWFVHQRHARPRWIVIRYWWSTLMVLLSGLSWRVAAGDGRGFAEVALLLVVIPTTILSLPLLLLVWPAVKLGQLLHLSGWPAGLTALACVWLAWYGIVRFLEWRSFRRAPHQGDATSFLPPQS